MHTRTVESAAPAKPISRFFFLYDIAFPLRLYRRVYCRGFDDCLARQLALESVGEICDVKNTLIELTAKIPELLLNEN